MPIVQVNWIIFIDVPSQQPGDQLQEQRDIEAQITKDNKQDTWHAITKQTTVK